MYPSHLNHFIFNFINDIPPKKDTYNYTYEYLWLHTYNWYAELERLVNLFMVITAKDS